MSLLRCFGTTWASIMGAFLSASHPTSLHPIPPHLAHFTSHLHPIPCHQLTSHLTHLASPPRPLHTPHLPTPSHLTSPHLTPYLLTPSHPTSPQPHPTSPQHSPTLHLLIPHLLTPSLPTSSYAPRSPGCGDEDLPLCLVPTRGAPIPIFPPPAPHRQAAEGGQRPQREERGGTDTKEAGLSALLPSLLATPPACLEDGRCRLAVGVRWPPAFSSTFASAARGGRGQQRQPEVKKRRRRRRREEGRRPRPSQPQQQVRTGQGMAAAEP